MKRLTLLLILVSIPAFAQMPESPSHVDPTLQALGQMEQEAHTREARALVRAYAAEAQIANLAAQLTAEKKRADDAEEKLKLAVSEPPKSSPN